MRQLAADGHAALQQHLREGHDALYLRDVDYLETNRALLIGERPGKRRSCISLNSLAEHNVLGNERNSGRIEDGRTR